MIRVVESELVGPSLACGRCDEHAREAKLIQSSLVPQQGLCHGSVEIACRYIPLFDVGGDFADFFVLPNGHIGIYLGDVVGKGLPAAMYSALVMGVLRGVHKTGMDTANVLTRLNDRLIQRPISGRFCSTLYALFNPATAELIFSNAGMELPLLAGQGDCRQLGEGGLPSGMFSGAAYTRHVCNWLPETAFYSLPMVFTTCATSRGWIFLPHKCMRFGRNAQRNRRLMPWTSCLIV